MNKRILISLAAISVFGASALCAQEFSFANEVSSDVVTVDNKFTGNENETNFAGISENASVEFSSEKVDAYLEVEFSLDTADTDHLYLAWSDPDYWLHFRPINMLTLAFHDDLWMNGSYLPVWDDNAGAGGLGSDGFTLMAEPIEGLRIAATIPLEGRNFFNGEDNDGEPNPFNFGIGAEYDFGELFSIGAKVNDIADGDERNFGIFAMVRPLQSDDLIIRAGFGHYEGGGALEELDYSESISLEGKNIINASVEWNVSDFAIAAEVAADTDSDDADNPYDMYIGANVGYGINEKLSAGLGGQCFLDFGDTEEKPAFGIEPSLGFTFGSHEFSVAADIEFRDGNAFVKFPLSWVYSF
ncbi:MAG: hypothetical protein NC041_08725 [Bacteroides sp.]|nr:hypothetical protein [Prevotella sp.]MCM1408674.1 hypothetical protein [Treponema brennaborense]MCM1470535.1 hypothetical protein [Bacteroides sp.]